MSIIQSVVIGIVQGLTEFLPVSSSGHILIAEKLLNVSLDAQSALLFSVILHMGTLLAVVIVYWGRLIDMVLHPIRSDLKYLVIATIPAVIAALVIDFSDAFEGAFLGFSFITTSVILIAGEAANKYLRHNQKLRKHVHLSNALAMGIMQAIAILPGVSRSGSTIAGGAASGLSRRKAADFAFLMSVPAILGSAVLEAKDLLFSSEPTPSFEFLTVAVGFAAAFTAGFCAIKGMLKMIKKLSLNCFAVYTAILGILILADKYIFRILGIF